MGRIIGFQSIGGIFRFIIAVLIVIPGIILAIISYFEFVDEKQHMAGHMRQIIIMQRKTIEEWLKEQENLIRSIARLSFVRTVDRQAMDYNFQEMLKIHPEFNALIFVNKNGIAEPQYKQPNAVDLSDRDYFKAALLGQDYITDVIISRNSGKPIVVISSPVYSFDGEFQGVVFGSVELSTMTKLLSDFKMGSTGKTYLVNKRGQIISHTYFSNERRLSADWLTEIPAVNRKGAGLALEGESGLSVYEDYRGEKVIGVYQTVHAKGLQGAVIAEIEMTEVLQPFYRQLGVVVALYFFMIIIAVPLAYWLAKRIKLPVEILTRDAYHMQQGDYSRVIPQDAFSNAPRELKLLCEVFNRMTIDIKGSIHILNQKNKELQYVSLHDSLTGLCNRSGFESTLRNLGNASHAPVGLIIVDVDGLKLVNDTLGHQAGDELIRAAAHTLRKTVSDSGVIARIGGDEFAVLLPRTGRDRLEEVCSRIKEAVNAHNADHPGLPLYLSLGYAVRYKPNFNAAEFFREADDFMYREKEAQRQAVRKKIQAAVKMAGIAGGETSA